MYPIKKPMLGCRKKMILSLFLVMMIFISGSVLDIKAATITRNRTTSSFKKIAIAQCNSHINVRKSPSTNASIVGTMDNNTAAIIKETKEKSDGKWYYIKSGSVTGYVKASYFVTGSAALKVAKKTAKKTAKVNTSVLRVRKEASTNSPILINLAEDKVMTVVKASVTGSDGETWSKIKVTQNGSTYKGYVCKKYIKLTYTMNTAKKYTAPASSSSGSSSSGNSSSGNSSSGSSSSYSNTSTVSTQNAAELGAKIASKAKTYVGVLPYVYGGESLSSGADCSGFVQSIYGYYGVSVPRTSSSQASASRSVSRDGLRVGDLVFYGNSGVSHVAIYIGNDQIVHEANETKGCIISNMYYMTPVKYGTFLH